MAWLWARIHTRGNSKQEGETKEYLGYFEGGFQQIADILAQKIKENGGKIETSCQIESIRGGEKIKIKVEGKWRQFDKCLATIPSSVLGKLIEPKDRYQKFINKLGSVDYLSALIIIFSSKQSLSRYYWHNINDLNSPFLAMIQHTNLIDKKNYQNEHIYYLGSYLPSDHQFFQQSDKELYDQYFNYLQKIFPKFDQKLISQKFLFRFGQAQHVVTTDYPKKIPDYKTPVKNLYLANFSQIFPEDRGTNFAVREGEKVARLIKDD
jgi:protoporphyrinogen oxidase